jgi:hypothetical protein
MLSNEPVDNFSCSFQVVFYHLVSIIFALCASSDKAFFSNTIYSSSLQSIRNYLTFGTFDSPQDAEHLQILEQSQISTRSGGSLGLH